MNQDIPYPDHLSPWNGCVFSFYFIWRTPCSLSYNFKISNYSIKHHFVKTKGTEIDSLSVSFNFVY